MGKGGKPLDGGTMTAVTRGSDLVHSDPRFAPFLSQDFDAASFASRALAETHSPQAQTEQLQAAIHLLEGQLRQEVTGRQAELISQASRLHESEASLQRLSLSVRSLQSVAARVRAEVAEPYRQIAGKSVQLRNLQRTVDLLRHAIHRLKLVQKLRAQMALEGAGAWQGSGGGRKGGLQGAVLQGSRCAAAQITWSLVHCHSATPVQPPAREVPLCSGLWAVQGGRLQLGVRASEDISAAYCRTNPHLSPNLPGRHSGGGQGGAAAV